MKVVVDIDNTLCVHRNRDYVNAVPIKEVIDKVNYLHDNGVEICLYTSRGMNSCKGDIGLIIERNDKILVDWLKRNGVKYDSIIYGKPLADYYIDDGGMGVKDFLDKDFNMLEGNSASSVIKFGKTIVKEAKNANFQYYWYQDFCDLGFDICKVPGNRLLTLNTVKMDYIDGSLLCHKFSYDALAKVLSQVKQFSVVQTDKNDLEKYLSDCRNCYSSSGYNYALDLINSICYIDVICSFCHGDLSFSNIILSGDDVYLIDPNDKEYSSYVLDLAKLRCSFDGLERMLGYDCQTFEDLIDLFDFVVEKEFGIDIIIVKLFEITRFARILPYMEKLGKEEAKWKIIAKIEELCASL